MCAMYPAHLILLRHSNYIWQRVQVMKLVINYHTHWEERAIGSNKNFSLSINAWYLNKWSCLGFLNNNYIHVFSLNNKNLLQHLEESDANCLI
jgi:hypothetical protein